MAGLGAAAVDATAKAAPLGEALDKTATSLKTASGIAGELTGVLKDKLAPAGEAARDAFEKLSRAETPRALQRGIVEAELAMEKFKTATDAAAASGVAMPPRVGQALKAMQSDIDASSVKLGELKNRMGDVADRANQAGQSFKYLQGAGGGAQGMFNALEGSANSAVSTLGKIGLSAIGIAGIFATAVGVGKALGAAFDFVAGKSERLSDIQNKGRAAAEQHAAAMRALDAGLITNSTTTQGLIDKYNLLVISQGRGSAGAKQAAADFAGVGTAMDDLGTKTQKAETISALLEGAFKRSGAEGLNMSIAMESALRKIEAEYRALGDAVPIGIRKALDAIDALKTRNADLAATAVDLNKKMSQLPAAMQNQINEATKLAAATKLVSDAHDKLEPSIVKILETLRQEIAAGGSVEAANARAAASLAAYAKAHELTAEQVLKMVSEQGDLVAGMSKTDEELAKQIAGLGALGGALDAAALKTQTFAEKARDAAVALREMNAEADRQTSAIKERNIGIDAAQKATSDFAAAQREGIVVEGQATIANLTLASATDAQNKSLEDLLRTQNAYSESLQKTLGVAKGWKDYLAQLLDSYHQGGLSLLSYKAALEAFETQLLQTFGSATGKAKAALEDMIKTVQTLIQTAGAGGAGPVDNSPTGALNRMFQ